MKQAILALVAAVIATIAAAEIVYRASTAPPGEAVHAPWSLGTMQFRTWNGNAWTAWIRDGMFELVPKDEGNWSRHSNRSIAFIGWDGEPWQARIDGNEFLLTHHGDWDGHIQHSDAIRYRDWEGRNQLRTVAQLDR